MFNTGEINDEKREKHLSEIKALSVSPWRKLLQSYLDWYKNGYLEKLETEFWVDFVRKFSAHDVYRFMIRYLKVLDSLPIIIEDSLTENKWVCLDDIDVIWDFEKETV